MHDNAYPHITAYTTETLQKLKFEAMAHPPYSPNLALSDYHLFGPLKEALRGHQIILDQEVKGRGTSVPRCSAKNFLSSGYQEACATTD